MYQLSRTIPVNEPGNAYLSRHEVWTGLMMKARNALPYVPQMQKCQVLEQGDGWLLRDIVFNNQPLRERVSFEPERRVLFDRVGGVEQGRIENIIGEDEHGNLTLTFAFGLTREGIPEGGDEEKKYFAPMEGAYFGAVAATLGAVRRTITEQGREKIPAAAEIDRAGDTGWIYEFFRVADRREMEPFLAMHSDDIGLTFNNYPMTVGKDALRANIGELWSKVNGMSHSFSGAWSLHDGQLGIAEGVCMYTRPDNTLFTVRTCTVLRRSGGKISGLRIHVDLNGL